MNREVTEKAEACISKMLDQLETVKIGEPDYERKINAACTAIHTAIEIATPAIAMQEQQEVMKMSNDPCEIMIKTLEDRLSKLKSLSSCNPLEIL